MVIAILLIKLPQTMLKPSLRPEKYSLLALWVAIFAIWYDNKSWRLLLKKCFSNFYVFNLCIPKSTFYLVRCSIQSHFFIRRCSKHNEVICDYYFFLAMFCLPFRKHTYTLLKSMCIVMNQCCRKSKPAFNSTSVH